MGASVMQCRKGISGEGLRPAYLSLAVFRCRISFYMERLLGCYSCKGCTSKLVKNPMEVPA